MIGYSAIINGVAVSAAQDLFEIVAPADAKVALMRLFVGQYTDFTDTEDELIPIEIIRGYTTSGSGGGTVTPGAMNPDMDASTATVERNNTTPASSGTAVTLLSETFNVRAGYVWEAPKPLPWETFEQYTKRVPILGASERGVVNIGAPADAFTVNATLEFAELR